MKRMGALIGLLKGQVIPATTIIAVLMGMQYVMADVNAKHKTAMTQIVAQKEQISQIKQNQAVVINTLKNIDKSLTAVRDSMINTQNKIWEISRDINKGN